MAITINGTGSITGISAGGLPDGSITTDDLAANAVTAAKLSTGAPSWTSGGVLSFNSGYGSVATAYGCRAWARVDGSVPGIMDADGGFTSFTDNGTGDFSFAFDNAFPDANYAVVCTGSRNNGIASDVLCWTAVHNLTTTGFDMIVAQTNSTFTATVSLSDLATRIGVAVFR